MKSRKCTKCGAVLPLTEEHFYKHKSTKTGFHTQCVECVKSKQREWREDPTNREVARVRASQHWHSKTQEERSTICNERRLMQRFKRTPEWYEKTLEEQGGHCALCAAVPYGRRLQVDHSHECCPCEGTRYTCGKCIRGLLCIDCNSRLGYLEVILYESFLYPEPCDNTWLERALKYLSNYRLKRHQ